MKGVGRVPHWFNGRPASAKLGMPSSRSGFSYSYVHHLHPKPDLKRSVPGPHSTEQHAFVPTRNALWNKPVSYNANSFAQKSSSTYATQEPRFDEYLTLDKGAGLMPYRRGMEAAAKLVVNSQRAPALQEEVAAMAGGGGAAVAPVLSALQKKRLKSARSVPRVNSAAAEKPPLTKKPWSSMIINAADATVSAMALMSVQYDQLALMPGAGRMLRPHRGDQAHAPRPASAHASLGAQKLDLKPARLLSASSKSFVSRSYASALASYSPQLAII